VRSIRRSTRFAAAAASASLLLAACGGGGEEPAAEDTAPADDGAAEEDMAEEDMAEEDMAEEDMAEEDMAEEDMAEEDMAEGDAAALPTDQFGAACEAIPEDGPGSSEGMAEEPAATAASNNPALETLVQLVGQVELVDTINGLEGATIFAPSNDAFTALEESDPELFETVANDDELLSTVLTYHVIPEEELDAQGLVDAGTATTVAEQDVTIVEGGAEGVQIEAAGGNTADVVCGNVETANATVHIIDQVLLPDVS
jgi:uncharacterized surface protein with fasciclin (FAS1) repeats